MSSPTNVVHPAEAADQKCAGALAKAPFPVIETEAALRIVSWNQGAERLFGVAQREALGQRLTDLLPSAAGAEAWQRLLQEEGATHTWTHARKDGSRVVCAWSCQALRDEQRGTHGALWFGHDMTTLAAHEEELRSLTLLLDVVQENLPLVLWSIDRAGIFNHHAGKALASAGLTKGQFLGKNIFDLYPEEATADIGIALTGEPTHTESTAHGMFWETWTLPLREEQGQVTGVVGMTLDVSTAKRVERELQARLDEINRQQGVIRALSTPIIQVWEGVLTLPMIGVIDSTRTAEVMDTLLEAVARTQARFAILDLTGVEAVDTKTASYLIDIVRALRLLGAEGLIAGIRPSVAQTVVALGVDLAGIVTLANLQASLQHCLVQMRRSPAGVENLPRSPSR